MKKHRPLGFGVELVARVVLLVLGGVIAMAGLIRPGLNGLAAVALGIATITLAAILPRVERIRLFGKHGLDARLGRKVNRSEADAEMGQNAKTRASGR